MDARFPALTAEQLESLDGRQFADKGGTAARSYRSRAQRDRDRVLYSSAFQRLAYVTQVTAPEAGHAFHNRLSHSLKVAQVGRRNAERLRRLATTGELTNAAAALAATLEPEAVEASCLAHDLGHPPFGHVSEKALHAAAQATLGKDVDGFEGNSQSFRIVTRLAVRVGDVPGLDLTRRTLNGLLKYPWGFSDDPASKANRKWGYYDGDGDAFRFARPGPDASPGDPEARCLEAEIMDWADDLTYAVHDLDDFFRAGLIPLDRLGDPSSLESEALADVLENARAAEPKAFPAYSSADLVAAVQDALEPYGPEGGLCAHGGDARQHAEVRLGPDHAVPRGIQARQRSEHRPGDT